MIGLLGILAFMSIFLAGWGISVIIRAAKLKGESVLSLRLKQLKTKQPQGPVLTHRTSRSSFLGRLIQGSGLKIGYGRVLTISISLCAASFFLALLVSKNILVGMALGAFAGLLPFFYLSHVRKRRIDTFEKQFPDAVALMASCLKAGHGLTAAISAVGTEMSKPIAEEFAQVLGEINLGVVAKDAFIHMEERIGSRDLRFFTAAVLLQKEVGGSLSEVFTNLEETVRERFELKGELKAMTAQQRLTGMILGFLPIGVGLVVYMLNPTYFSTLFEDPWGQTLLIAGVILQILGFIAIKKLVSISFD